MTNANRVAFQLLAKLYIYNYIRSLQKSAGNAPEVFADPGEFISSLCEILRPYAAVVEEADEEKDSFTARPAGPCTSAFQTTSKLSLSIIYDLLAEELLSSSASIRSKVTIAIATHADESIPWVTGESARLSAKILEAHKEALTSEDILVQHVLKDVVKPVFGKGPKTITEQGRKAMRVPAGRPEVFSFSDEKPWRKDKPEALALLMFAVSHLKHEAVIQNWHLIVPPILTTLDEGDVPSKTYACKILASVIRAADVEFLARTGLGSVFEEAMSPCLHFLPPLTPVKVAMRSFSAAVAGLMALATYQWAGIDDEKYFKSVDKILREGVFHGMTYAGENVHMVMVFLQEMRTMIGVLGVRAVRHLAKLIPLCTEPMVSPFMMTYPDLAFQAAAALADVIKTCWPRISDYNGEILKAVVFCWLRLSEDKENEPIVPMIKEQLVIVMKLLQTANKGNGWFDKAKDGVLQRDRRFEELFLAVESC
ncbi:hypothetical protein ABW19_dt0210045 [Dactylella cylindrospora]|nr:hypothetical protein ABW19_dt0210045 [Dactylella cylindrospora]